MNSIIDHLKRSPVVIFGLVALVVCIGFGLLRSNQIKKLSALETELNAKLDTMRLNVNNSENIQSDIETLEGLLSAVDERLFISEERSTNIDFFYSFEEKLDIKISEVKQLEGTNPRYSPEGPNKLKLYTVIDYSITVSGTFHEILRFLYEIYQIDTIARVTEFKIDTNYSNSESDPGALSAEIKVAVLAVK